MGDSMGGSDDRGRCCCCELPSRLCPHGCCFGLVPVAAVVVVVVVVAVVVAAAVCHSGSTCLSQWQQFHRQSQQR